MGLLPVDKLGARETTAGTIEFGFLLPGITAAAGYQTSVSVIHSLDFGSAGVQPVTLALSEQAGGLEGWEYWTSSLAPPSKPSPLAGPNWGSPGQYLYWLGVTAPGGFQVDGLTDPFAREFGGNDKSGISLGYPAYEWSAGEQDWKVPAVQDLIVYELMMAEFAGPTDAVKGTIAKLDYLQGLGINCIEVMPVTKVETQPDWGYEPIGPFAVDDRFGGHNDFKCLVDEAHKRGIAVIADVVYGHTSIDFLYQSLYWQLRLESPTSSEGDNYGPKLDHTKPLTQQLVLAANCYWLAKFHLDGLRYDEVGVYWDGPIGSQFAGMAYDTYQHVQSHATAKSPGYWARFADESGGLNLIQTAEYLSQPTILGQCYANSTWQDETLNASRDCAAGRAGAIDELGYALAALGFPATYTNGSDSFAVAPFQYVESHDHERLLCSYGYVNTGDPLTSVADRSNWRKLRPYLIGLLTSKGVPMLWEGQEFAENYYVPPDGQPGRVAFRPVDWSFQTDEAGSELVNLVTTLTGIRSSGEQFRSGDFYYQNNYDQWQSRGLLLFTRYTNTAFSLVALNFTDTDVNTEFWFTVAGDYGEEIDGAQNLTGVVAGSATPITVPANHGCVWTLLSPL